MVGTIIDTTSLIALATSDKGAIDPSLRRIRKSGSLALSGIEALLISQDIIIDLPSYERNLTKYPQLESLSGVAQFINDNEKSEDECYERCADVIVPMMNRPGEFLINVQRRHISILDYCDLSVNDRRFAPSTYWRDLSGRLSKSENRIVKALESQFGENTPFSGAALSNLIRFLYYASCQDVYKTNLSLHPMKSSFLTGIGRPKFMGEERTAKSIIDVFDKEITDKYRENSKKWLGQENLTMNMPLLEIFVKKNRNTNYSLIEDLLRIRELKECRNFRAGIKELQESLNQQDKFVVNDTLVAIEQLADDLNRGINEDPSKHVHKIALSIPFVGGLGTEISIKIPKVTKTPKDKILTFLHKVSHD